MQDHASAETLAQSIWRDSAASPWSPADQATRRLSGGTMAFLEEIDMELKMYYEKEFNVEEDTQHGKQAST